MFNKQLVHVAYLCVGSANIAGLCRTTSVDHSDRTACSAVSELVVRIAIVLALCECTLFEALVLELGSIFFDGEVGVDEIGNRKADAVRGRGCGKRRGEERRESEERARTSLHLGYKMLGDGSAMDVRERSAGTDG
jgi:hypothetical protein